MMTPTQTTRVTATTERGTQINAILARIEGLRPRSAAQAKAQDHHTSPLDSLTALAAVVTFTTERSFIDVLLLIEHELRQDRHCSVDLAAHRVEARLLGL